MTQVGKGGGGGSGITPALRRAAQCSDYSGMGSAMIDMKGKKVMYENTAFEKLYREVIKATQDEVGEHYKDENVLLTLLGRDAEKLSTAMDSVRAKQPIEFRSMIKASRASEVGLV